MLSIAVVYRIKSPEVNDGRLGYSLWDITTTCLNGIIETADQPYELIAIDNGSYSPEFASELNMRANTVWHGSDYLLGFKQLRFEEHVSLSKAWNIALHQSDGDYLCLANNDLVFFETGWMTKLTEPFELENRRVGITGIVHMSWNRFTFVEGCLFVIPRYVMEEVSTGISEEEPHYPLILDEQFELSGEDVDLNRRVQDLGYETIQVNLQPRWVQHLGHRTVNSMSGTHEDYIKMSHESRIKLCHKYGYPEQIVD